MSKRKPYPTEKRRKWTLRQRYGLEFGEYETRLQEQDFKCYLCSKLHGEVKGKRLCVDHDHDTNEVRKLLCPSCNRDLTGFEMPYDKLERVLMYLREHNSGAMARLELLLREMEQKDAED